MNKNLKRTFWSNLCVESAFQILDIRQYACGLKRTLALTLNQNPLFETGFSLTGYEYEKWNNGSGIPSAIRVEVEGSICPVVYRPDGIRLQPGVAG
jgi:hypothetical protein